MTTILIKHPIMISDTKGGVYSTKGVPTIRTLIKHHVSTCNRFAYGVTGEVLGSTARSVLEKFITQYLRDEYDSSDISISRKSLGQFCQTHDITIIFATTDRVFRADDEGSVLQISIDAHVAIGAGAGYVTGALRCGLPALAAMKFAGSMDGSTGDEYFTITHLDQLTPFMEG